MRIQRNPCLDFSPEPELRLRGDSNWRHPGATFGSKVYQALGDGSPYRRQRNASTSASSWRGADFDIDFFHYVAADFAGPLDYFAG